ncbi:hypothetical protein A4G19_12450 [Pasteurellaceae bacterium Macca]|nr:hypothetical protein [Pasteurellaceae bacterium Macca]MCK3656521.1 hypothetical protein [Pasteurellaceae bacterium Macca]
MRLLNQSARFRNRRFRQTIQVKRLAGQHSVSGFKAEYVEERLTAIVIPTTPQDMLLLPEQERYLPSIKVLTLVALNIGDLVLHQGIEYKIQTKAHWGDYGYHHQIAVRHSPTAKVDSTGFATA